MTNDPGTGINDAHRVAVEEFSDWDEDDAFDAADAGLAASGTRPRAFWTMLTDLDDVLRSAGLHVVEEDGWQQRARSSTGYSGNPVGIIVHHTGGGEGADGRGDVNVLLNHPEARPMSNLYLDRKGTWWVLAAGATNTNGKGGPVGPIPVDGANSRVIGIEAGNRGTGEPWPVAMQDSYVQGVAALADRYGIDTNNIFSHFEWAGHTPRRKIDPAGPSRFGSINVAHTWDMNKFRAEVNEVRTHRSAVEVVQLDVSDHDMYVVQPGDAWWSIAEKTMGNPAETWEQLAEANGGRDRLLIAGQVLTIPGRAAPITPEAEAAGATSYPGEAKRGMQGPVVLVWQQALIAHGVIADNHDNRDGVYGEGMERAVLALQRSWDWSDADGIAGRNTWKKLHS